MACRARVCLLSWSEVASGWVGGVVSPFVHGGVWSFVLLWLCDVCRRRACGCCIWLRVAG